LAYSCLTLSFVFVGTEGRRGRDRMVVGLTTIYSISGYHH